MARAKKQQKKVEDDVQCATVLVRNKSGRYVQCSREEADALLSRHGNQAKIVDREDKDYSAFLESARGLK